jgi:actin-related protein 6
MTEPYFNPPNVQETYDQFIFEEYEFQSFYRCARMFSRHQLALNFLVELKLATASILYGNIFNDSTEVAPECSIMVDSGFSYTHVVPMVRGLIQWDATLRYDSLAVSLDQL